MGHVVARAWHRHSIGCAVPNLAGQRYLLLTNPTGTSGVNSLTFGVNFSLFTCVRPSFSFTEQEPGHTSVALHPFLNLGGVQVPPIGSGWDHADTIRKCDFGTLHGYGSFVAKNLATSLFLLDGFIGVIGTMTLILAAMVVDQRRIGGELLDAHNLLQEKAEKMEEELVVTGQALEVELFRHDQSRKALGQIKERFRQLGESINPEEKRK